LQSNKARLAASVFDAIETVDRIGIAERLSRELEGRSATLEVLVQVNVSGEATKSGVVPEAAPILAQEIARLPGLNLRGIMGIPEPTSDTVRQHLQLRRLRECYDACRATGLPFDTLSMGMSADLEAAIAEGATEVRVGTAIFGTRVRA
jgi:pyridoxal phosphate enzyme (YggS family)